MKVPLDSDKLLFVQDKNPVHRVSEAVRLRLIRAQQVHITKAFDSSASLLANVLDELKLNIAVPPNLTEEPVQHLADMPYSDLCVVMVDLLRSAGIPEDALRLQAVAVAQRLHLLRAFEYPDKAVERIIKKISDIVTSFPRAAKDIECGRNPGDVLDPYILAATQILLHGGDFTSAIATTVAHKALMIIEGLLGHLHEDVLGDMRGNVRVPEPRGGMQQEIMDLETNPFPGADVVQPPYNADGSLRFHQVKSKTGSAKGGDGRRLGEQLKRLRDYYGGEIYYDALIGNTLRGHRSRMGVERAAPGVAVLVGDAAFRELTHSNIGPQLLLRVYQAAFQQVAHASGYRVELMSDAIVAAFKTRADAAGDTIMETILDSAIKGDPKQQDSRLQKKP